MNQIALDFSAPPLAQARAVGERASQLATAKTSRITPEFRERAAAAILKKLAAGPASGEDITDYVRSTGLAMRDGRDLGSIYSRLIKDKLIEPCGTCKRRRGNGTGGGSIYRLGAAT